MVREKLEKHIVVTVTGKDRPGIIAAISKELFNQGCNIMDTLMSILQGEFAMILIAKPVIPRFLFSSFARNLSELGRKSGLHISVRQSSLKKNSSGIEHRESSSPPLNRGGAGPTYIVSVFGTDKPGIVSSVSEFFGKKNINIVDMKTLISEDEKYAMLMEIDIPKNISFSYVEKELSVLGKKLRVHIDIQHSGIFKAMHRI